MKRLLLLFFLAPLFSTAQNATLQAEGAAPNLYLNHTVAAKENYYSVGRMYNISPKEIAPFNNLQLDKGINLGQTIKVPLTENNFSQKSDAASDEALVPVYHTVKDKEGLYRIATNYNKLPLETLKQWNGIKGDAVSSGTKLIVGYLKVKKELSALAGGAKSVPAVAVKEAPPAKEVPKPVVKEIPEVVKAPEPKPVKEKVPPVVKQEEPVEAPVKKEPAPVAVKEPAPVRTGKSFNGGYFKNDFSKQGNADDTETGTAAIFKSTSGWEDGKYYCLHNTAAAGSIVKVTNTATGKTVYAKVLDVIPDIKQNNGLLVRLSNAAASELGANDKFDCTVSFSK